MPLNTIYKAQLHIADIADIADVMFSSAQLIPVSM